MHEEPSHTAVFTLYRLGCRHTDAVFRDLVLDQVIDRDHMLSHGLSVFCMYSA